MIASRRRRVHGFALLALVVAACDQLPELTFPSTEDSGSQAPAMDASTPDASSVSDATLPPSDAAGKDASPAIDAPSDATTPLDAAEESPTDEQDDASDASLIRCGDAMVANCAGCAEGFLRCVTSTEDYCVTDCTSCSTGSVPCVHCPGNAGKPRGVCLPVNPKTGLAACTAGNLCPCDAATDCPAIPGAPQTCEAPDSGKKYGCMTCGGTAASSGLACVPSSAEAGVCEIAPDTSPTCN